MLEARLGESVPAAHARFCLSAIDPDAAAHVGSFVMDQLHPDGGFKGRDGGSDLYYTLFGLDCLDALRMEVSTARFGGFLGGFGLGEGLDLVEKSCLARCLLRIGEDGAAAQVRARFEDFRVVGGGYALSAISDQGSIYAAYLVHQSLLEVGEDMAKARGVLAGIEELRTRDGGFAERRGCEFGTTTVTGAAAILLSELGEVSDEAARQMLRSTRHNSGGYCASPVTPLPDLLSTAAALLALGTTEAGADTTAFVEDLWQENGGFSGHLLDVCADCEYTYYALLTLGLCAKTER